MDTKQISVSFLNSVKKILFKSHSRNSFFKKLYPMRTGFLSQNIPFSHNIYRICTVNLEDCENFKELRHLCLNNTNHIINLINSKIIEELMSDKIKNENIVLAIGNNAKHYLSNIKKKYRIFNKNLDLKDINIAFIDTDAITNSGIVMNKEIKNIIQNLHKNKIRTYICASIFDFDKEEYSKEHILNPALVSGIISELGIYIHQDFIHTLEKEYPILFDFF